MSAKVVDREAESNKEQLVHDEAST
jgi:hypothetical protein